jgi:cytochrome c oxidase subunit 2
MVGALATMFLFTLGVTLSAQTPSPEQQDIDVSAKKYEFSPAEIRVKKGAKVRLKIHAVDEDHGMKLSLYPEGSKDKSTPGLVFDNPQDNGKVEKGKDQILEFVAQQTGTYEFKCAVVCGIHHGRMKGKLIVEE